MTNCRLKETNSVEDNIELSVHIPNLGTRFQGLRRESLLGASELHAVDERGIKKARHPP